MNSYPQSWPTIWSQVFSLPADVPNWLVATLLLITVFMVIIVPSAAIMAVAERRLGARLQARIGPNRTGPAGLLQPLADLLKLFQKTASPEINLVESFWLTMHTMALYATVAVMPLGSMLLLVDTDMSAFLPFWAALLMGFCTIHLGLSQNTVTGWLGGLRIAAQTLSGAFPALIALICAGIHAGGYKWSLIAQAQGASPFSWTAIADPFQFAAFCVFLISGLILFSIPPMDGGHSTQDIHGGVSMVLHGRRLSLFRLGRFYGIFLWSVITSTLFLGGWTLPEQLLQTLTQSGSWKLHHAFEITVLLIKSFVLMLLMTWVERVNPRARLDQTTDFAWRVLSPLALLALIGGALSAWWRTL